MPIAFNSGEHILSQGGDAPEVEPDAIDDVVLYHTPAPTGPLLPDPEMEKSLHNQWSDNQCGDCVLRAS
eukprot:12893295-Prorocentrum_lima.AAC.1